MVRLPALAVAAAVAVASLAGAETPEQFRVWGRRAAPNQYLADPGPAPAGRPGLEATPAELKDGVVVYRRPAFDPPPAGFVPSAADRCRELEVTDCPGQYGPLSFGVCAVRDTVLSLTVTGLRGPGGRTIGPEHFDIRAVRSIQVAVGDGLVVIPLLLESFDRANLPAGDSVSFWVTYHVPADAAPGAYDGVVRCMAGGRELSSVSLRLNVLPFRLVDPELDLYMYSQDPGGPKAVAREYADMRLHGMTTGWVHAPVTPEGVLAREAMGGAIESFRQAGFPRRVFFTDLANRVTCRWLNDPDKSIGMWGPWFRYLPLSDALDRRVVELLKLIRDESRARGLAPIIEVGDEAGSHAWTIAPIKHYLELMKREVPDLTRELTVGGGWASNEPEHDHWRGLLDIWTTNRWLADQLAIVRSREPGVRFQLYNMAGAGSAPGGLSAARHLFGFYAWAAGVAGAAQWVYFHTGTPEHNYAWPAEGGGFVPTLRWEAVREGAKDRRYLATLEAALAGKTGPAADEARSFLGEVRDAIRLFHEDYDPVSGGRVHAPPPRTLDRWRDRMAELMVKL